MNQILGLGWDIQKKSKVSQLEQAIHSSGVLLSLFVNILFIVDIFSIHVLLSFTKDQNVLKTPFYNQS